MRQLAGNIGGKMASKRQLGGNLGHLKANLRPKRAQDSIRSEGVGGMREAVFSSAGRQLGVIHLTLRAGVRHSGLASRPPPDSSPQSGAPAAA